MVLSLLNKGQCKYNLMIILIRLGAQDSADYISTTKKTYTVKAVCTSTDFFMYCDIG